MRISIVICTRNRAASLQRALASISSMHVPAGLDWELIVVDNGSTDQTSSVITSFQDRLPIQLIVEPLAGLSRARNTGVQQASGKYILWTDDDVEVRREWLAGYTEAFTRFPDDAVFGGKITPVFEGPVPAWLSTNMDLLQRCFAARDLGNLDVKLAVESDLIPFGANYAIRAHEQRRFLYDVALGAGSGGGGVGEETAVIKQILQSGHTGRWVSSSEVLHHVAQSRISPSNIADWFRAVGYSMQHESRSKDTPMFGAPRWMWRDVVQRYFKYAVCRVTRPAEVWIRYLARYALSRGQLQFWLSSKQR